ncbi:MAG: AMP-binding protein, partial [Psychrosphaera sp.]|nr:AMP-binding protein [Psychrosphaera sp.]
GLYVEWLYAKELFDDSTMVAMADHFECLMSLIASQPTLKISELQQRLLQHGLLQKQVSDLGSAGFAARQHGFYWAQQLADVSPLTLPQTVKNEGVDYQQINAQMPNIAAPLVVTMNAAFALLLSRYSNSDDVVFAVHSAQMTQAQLVRVAIASQTGDDYLAKVSTVLDAAAQHSQWSLDVLAQLLNDSNVSELADIVLTVDQPRDENTDEGKRPSLELVVTQAAQNIELSWHFDAALYDNQTIIAMNDHLIQLVSELVSQPTAKVTELSMLSQAETSLLINDLNDTQTDYEQHKTIQQFFEQQVEINPDQQAVVFEGNQLTYAELNGAANRLAYRLRASGVERGTLVGICLERSIDMVVSILAVLKAGGAYVPLDPEFPQKRHNDILEDTGIKQLLTHQNTISTIDVPADVEVIALDETQQNDRIAQYSSDNLPAAGHQSSDLAYVIYTSGSTGKPKGVMVAHRAL